IIIIGVIPNSNEINEYLNSPFPSILYPTIIMLMIRNHNRQIENDKGSQYRQANRPESNRSEPDIDYSTSTRLSG
ncbi:hypothetical protein PZW76_15280, partial [Klebsiella pneumoniae]